MLVYLCRQKCGRWVMDKESKALMPPYTAVEGPLDFYDAQRACMDRNLRAGFRVNKKEKRYNGRKYY